MPVPFETPPPSRRRPLRDAALRRLLRMRAAALWDEGQGSGNAGGRPGREWCSWMPACAGMTKDIVRPTILHPSPPRRCCVPEDWLDGIGVDRGISYVRERLGPCK